MDKNNLEEKYRSVLKTTKILMKTLIELKEYYDLNLKFSKQLSKSDILAFFIIFSWDNFKIKRQLKKINKNIDTVSKMRLRLRCYIFKTQYLQRDLKAAIRIEDYEQAATIRDKMVVDNLEKLFLDKK